MDKKIKEAVDKFIEGKITEQMDPSDKKAISSLLKSIENILKQVESLYKKINRDAINAHRALIGLLETGFEGDDGSLGQLELAYREFISNPDIDSLKYALEDAKNSLKYNG